MIDPDKGLFTTTLPDGGLHVDLNKDDADLQDKSGGQVHVGFEDYQWLCALLKYSYKESGRKGWADPAF